MIVQKIRHEKQRAFNKKTHGASVSKCL